jgi:hypothetical protein
MDLGTIKGVKDALGGTVNDVVLTAVTGGVRTYLRRRGMQVGEMMPLFVNLGLGIALFSNAGKLFWGFNADWDVVSDLTAFVGGLRAAFRELCALVPGQSPLTVSETRKPSRRAHELVSTQAGSGDRAYRQRNSDGGE